MVNGPHFGRVGIVALAIKHQGVIGPGIPQSQHRLHKFVSAAIALGMARHGFITVVACFHIEHRGDHIPANTPAGNVIQRGYQTGGVKRGVKRAGNRADEANVFGGAAHGGDGGKRLQIPPASIRDITHRVAVGKKYRIQFAAFGGLRQALVIADIAQLLHRRLRMAPGSPMVAAAHQEQVDVHHALPRL